MEKWILSLIWLLLLIPNCSKHKISEFNNAVSPTIEQNNEVLAAPIIENYYLGWTESQGNFVQIIWYKVNYSKGIAGYIVNHNGIDLSMQTNLSFFTTQLPSGYHTFNVKAQDIKGNESPYSENIAVIFGE